MVSYENGLIPPSLLRRVSNFRPLTSRVNSNVGSDLLREDAWAAATVLQVAFLNHFGRSLNISEAYRGRTLQTAYYRDYLAGVGNLAAVPGTSNHGWAISIDFGSGVGTYGSAAKVWMDANAPRYGWWPEGNGFSRREGWHYLYKPNTATEVIPAAGDLSPFPTSPTSPPVIPLEENEVTSIIIIGADTPDNPYVLNVDTMRRRPINANQRAVLQAGGVKYVDNIPQAEFDAYPIAFDPAEQEPQLILKGTVSKENPAFLWESASGLRRQLTAAELSIIRAGKLSVPEIDIDQATLDAIPRRPPGV
jgi:hypothetical protein